MDALPGAPTLETIRRSVSTVPWPMLAHAYHGAGDAPDKLAVFFDSDVPQEALDDALEWMWSSLLHQGSLYSATAPALWILTDLVAAKPKHPASTAILHGLQTVTEGLIDIPDDASRTAVRHNSPGDPAYDAWTETTLGSSMAETVDDEEYFKACRPSARALLSLIRHAVPVMIHCLAHPDDGPRTAAVAAGLGAMQVVPSEALALHKLVELVGDTNYDPGVWVSVAMIMGRLGHPMSGLLRHADRRVRLAGAMSPATRDDGRSVNELASAIGEPLWLEKNFPNGAAHLPMHLRFHVLRALLDRIEPDTVEPGVVEAICTLIRLRAGKYTVDAEWGPVLHWAFRERWRQRPAHSDPAPLPERLTSTQTVIVKTLCDKDELWDPTNGNAGLAYQRIQLPYDRDILCRLVSGE